MPKQLNVTASISMDGYTWGELVAPEHKHDEQPDHTTVATLSFERAGHSVEIEVRVERDTVVVEIEREGLIVIRDSSDG